MSVTRSTKQVKSKEILLALWYGPLIHVPETSNTGDFFVNIYTKNTADVCT